MKIGVPREVKNQENRVAMTQPVLFFLHVKTMKYSWKSLQV